MSLTTVSNTGTGSTLRSRILLSPSKRRRVSHEAHHELGTGTHVNGLPNVEDIWKWTMTPDAVTFCFVRDVFDMKENLIGDADFYWLGRVPCRSVCLVGLVVGLHVFESKVIYSIDDGTAVIDCAHKVQRLPQTPKRSNNAKAVREMPRPVAHIGSPIRVTGKVQRAYGSRQILVDEIELCKSANEEPLHWIRVRELHKTSYDLDKPFVIPVPAAALAISIIAEPTTPSTSRASSVASSPTKSALSKSSPLRLRHPSRLRSRDLNDNIFRIYVKHYMVYAPTDAPEAIDDGFESDVATDEPTTPIEQPTIANQFLTPKPANRKITADDQTPQPRIQGKHMDGPQSPTPRRHYGFTLSYLRRVPELADMARRVVTAEAKRRAREQRGRHGSTSSSAAVALDLSLDKVVPKMKRLFKWAIVQLLHEGSIVLWDEALGAYIRGSQHDMSDMWKTSISSCAADSTVFGMSGEARHDDGEILTEELSDPETDEEGYIAVRPALLGDYVEDVMRAADGRMSRTSTTPGLTKEEILGRLHKDDRWGFLGEWQVQEALDYLQQGSRAWYVGDRWELTV